MTLTLQVDRIGFSEFAADLLGKGTSALRHLSRRAIKVTDHHDKFIPANACDGVHVAHTGKQPPCNFHQQQIASVMSVGIVQRFEAVEINVERRTVFGISEAGGYGLLQTIFEQPPVWKLCERVMQRHLHDLFFKDAPFGDIAAD